MAMAYVIPMWLQTASVFCPKKAVCRVMFILRNNPYRVFRWAESFPAVLDIADMGLLILNGEEVTETTVTLEHGDRFQWFPGDVC